MTDRLELHIIELEKLERRNNKSKEEEELLNWCKFIKFPEKVEESIIMKNEEIKKAKEQLDKMSQDKKERRLAELREKAIKDEMAIRDSGYNEGRKEGLKEGIKKTAKNMLEMKIDKEIISKVTGLTMDEIENM